MSKVTVSNKSNTPFSFPNREAVSAGGTIDFERDVWDQFKEHVVVKGWLNSKRLVVSGEEGDLRPTDADASKGPTPAEDEERLRAMAIPELTAMIEKAGAKDRVKSGMNKEDLVKVALELLGNNT